MRDRAGTKQTTVPASNRFIQKAVAEKGKGRTPSKTISKHVPDRSRIVTGRMPSRVDPDESVLRSSIDLQAAYENLSRQIAERERVEDNLLREQSELQVHRIELEMQNEELRRLQAELEVSRARYFDLYDLAPVGYLTISEKGLILDANLMAATLLGVSKGELDQQRLSRFVLPEDQDTYYLHRKRLLDTEMRQVCELGLVKKDGTPFWARIEEIVVRGDDEAPLCRALISDITERRRVEERERLLQEALLSARDNLERLVAQRTAKLAATNRRLLEEIAERKKIEAARLATEGALRGAKENFQRSLDDSPLGVRIVTAVGETLYANRALLDIYGYDTLDELKATPVKARYAEESYTEFKARFQKRLRDEQVPAEYEISIIRKDGEVRRLQVFRRAVLWDSQEQFQAIYLDITGRMRMEKELREREVELAAESGQLAETNTALRVLLQRRDQDIREMEKKIVSNFQQLVLPYLGELQKHRLSPAQLNYLDIIESNLQQIIDPFLQNLTARFANFTSREIQIAGLIKDGKFSKEIADILMISVRSVEFHRDNIRKKLGIAHKASNLRSFLLTLPK